MTTANPGLPDVLALLAQMLTDTPNTEAAVPAPRAMPERVLLTVEEAAEQLRIGRTVAWRLVSSGELESVQIGRLRRVHVDAVRAYAAGLPKGNVDG